MCSVGADRFGEIGPVVDNKRYVARMADRHQALAGGAHSIVIGTLETELHAAHVPTVERRGQVVDEGIRSQLRWRDKVEAAFPLCCLAALGACFC